MSRDQARPCSRNDSIVVPLSLARPSPDGKGVVHAVRFEPGQRRTLPLEGKAVVIAMNPHHDSPSRDRQSNSPDRAELVRRVAEKIVGLGLAERAIRFLESGTARPSAGGRNGSMFECPLTGEDHGHLGTGFVARVDDLGIADGAARLGHGADALSDAHVHAVPEREEPVRDHSGPDKTAFHLGGLRVYLGLVGGVPFALLYLQGEHIVGNAESVEADTVRVFGIRFLHRDLGAYERAQQAYGQALELARRTRTGFLLTYILDAQGNTWRLQGDLEQAGELLAQAL